MIIIIILHFHLRFSFIKKNIVFYPIVPSDKKNKCKIYAKRKNPVNTGFFLPQIIFIFKMEIILPENEEILFLF